MSEEKTESKENNFFKKYFLLIFGLALIFIAIFAIIYIFDQKTDNLSIYANNFYSFLIN